MKRLLALAAASATVALAPTPIAAPNWPMPALRSFSGAESPM